MTYINKNAALIADYADLGVSCGYIGDISFGPARDDRSFRVFTNLKSASGYSASAPVFDVPRDHKGIWKDEVTYDTPAVRAHLDRFRALLAEGKLIRR